MIRVMSVCCLLLATGCQRQEDGPPRAAIVQGVPCIPDQYRVQAPPWVQESADITNEGVAFRGCHAEAQVGSCPFPAEVSGGAVSWRVAPAKFLRDMPAGAFHAELAVQQRANASVDPASRLTIVPEPDSSDRWLLWKSATGQLSPDAELIAVCRRKVASAAIGRAATIKCNRTVQSDSFSVAYTFSARQKAPLEIERLDKQVLSVLNGWGCAKNSLPGR